MLVKGQISLDEAEKLLRIFAIEEIGNMVRIDVGREIRRGMPEVILAEGKRPEDVAQIALRMIGERGRAIVSRATREQIHTVKAVVPNDVSLDVYDSAGLIVARKRGLEVKKTGGRVESKETRAFLYVEARVDEAGSVGNYSDFDASRGIGGLKAREIGINVGSKAKEFIKPAV